MGAGSRARRLPGVHPQGEYRRRLSCRRACAARSARLLLSAIRHPQRPYRRRHRHDGGRQALRVPAALRHGRGAASRGGAARGARQALPHLCAGRRLPAICSPISCAGCLENGANTSFVNRLADDEAPIAAIVADPVEKAAALSKGQSADSRPAGLFLPERRTVSACRYGRRRSASLCCAPWQQALASAGGSQSHRLRERGRGGRRGQLDHLAHDRRVVVGTCRVGRLRGHRPRARPPPRQRATPGIALGGEARASMLDRAADLFEADRAPLMALMVREAGKTLANAQGDLREAMDHLRYSAAEARRQFAAPRELRGPTESATSFPYMVAACSQRFRRGTSRSPSSPDRSRRRSPPAMRWSPSRQSRRHSSQRCGQASARGRCAA